MFYNQCFRSYSNEDLFKSKLLSKKSKLWLYHTLVRPMVTYAYEMWVLKENIKLKLMVKKDQLMLKGDVSNFIVRIRLP